MLELGLGIFEMPGLAAMETGLPVSWKGVVRLGRKTVVRRLVAVRALGV
jgi:hypothetical protein